MKTAGLHMRFHHSLSELTDKADRLALPFFQFFLVAQATGRYIEPTHDEIDRFTAYCSQRVSRLYVHASYWINLAGLNGGGVGMLRREQQLARQLGATHLIVHPGSARGFRSKREGIECLARSLNMLLAHDSSVTVVLENTAHNKLSVGGDITDFAQVRELLDKPEALEFCIDTAHAYAYGYDLADLAKQQEFIDLVEACMGWEQVALLHINDTRQLCASFIDQHCVPDQGVIGLKALEILACHERLKNVPCLLELPSIDEQCEDDLLTRVSLWR